MTTTEQRFRRSAMVRRACALAGLFVLLLQGTNGGHMLLVEHTHCAEHGDLVHGTEAHQHADGAQAEVDAAALEAGSDDASEAAHAHCSLNAERRDGLVAVSDAELSPCLTASAELSAAPTTFASAGAERFRLAPKNSPPA